MSAIQKLIDANNGAVYKAVDYRRFVNEAKKELHELQAIKEAAWKLIEHPTSEVKLNELARVLGVEL